MISGVVTESEARIELTVKGKGGRSASVAAIVDTGFTDWITLPPGVVADLRLKWNSFGKAILADGSVCLFDRYEANVDWGGQRRSIIVDELDADPLLGMMLLAEHELRMQVRTGGKVTIKPLSRRKDG